MRTHLRTLASQSAKANEFTQTRQLLNQVTHVESLEKDEELPDVDENVSDVICHSIIERSGKSSTALVGKLTQLGVLGVDCENQRRPHFLGHLHRYSSAARQVEHRVYH
jgi:hypothetical protein